MLPDKHSPRRLTVLFIALLVLFTLLAAAQAAQATPPQQDESTPTVEVDTEGTPALLLTPPVDLSQDEPSKPGALLWTALLLMCGMVGMLVAGIGIAVLMVRLRSRIKG